MHELNQRQVAAILCGLRMLQQRLRYDSPRAKSITDEHRAILTNDGTLKPLSIREMEALCVSLNLALTFTLSLTELNQLIDTLTFAESEAAIAGEEVDSDHERRQLARRGKTAARLLRRFERKKK